VVDALPDYFSLFHLEPRFELDASDLTRRYRDIQGEIHPDRFAGKPVHEQRLAVQQAAYVNEAYQCLKRPLSRAKYLLALHEPALAGVPAALDTTFLMEQMELREQLDALSRTAAIEKHEAFFKDIARRCTQAEQEFLRELNAKHFESASTMLAKWQFLDKLAHEAQALLDKHD